MSSAAISERQFVQLTQACDRLLLDPECFLDLFAVPWLHIINEVPFLLPEYVDVIQGMDAAGKRTSLKKESPGRKPLSRWVVDTGRIGKDLGRSLSGSNHALQTFEHPGKTDVLILSLLLNADHFGSDEDFYFGRLQHLLDRRGISSILVCRNYTRHTGEALYRIRQKQSGIPLILPDRLGLPTEIGYVARCLMQQSRLKRKARAAVSPVEKIFLREVIRRILSRETIKNLRLHDQIRSLCLQTRPSILITLYEGHAWERVAWHAARSVSSRILCVGYQHVVFRKHSHSVKRFLPKCKGFDPDLVLTLGKVTEAVLKKSNGCRGIRTIPFGTHRYRKETFPVTSPVRKQAVLVLPEGVESETLILFNFAIQCAVRLPSVAFIFRTHPVFPFEKVKDRLCPTIEKLSNIEVSDKPDVDLDFDRSGYLMYRGSSTVIYAVLKGLKPFYIAQREEMNFDPLYELEHWRETVATVEAFVDLFFADQEKTDRDRSREWHPAFRYCREYVQSVDESALDHMIDLANAEFGHKLASC